MYSPIGDIQSEAKWWLHLAFYGCGKCAANLVMSMGLQCTTDFRRSLIVTIPLFPSVKDMQRLPVKHDLTSSPLPSIAILTSKAPQPSKTPKFRSFPLRTNDYPPKEPNASWSKLWEFIGHLRTDKAIRPHLYIIFQTYEALGLPMCHVLTVSGSSLPVPIYIGRQTDHIILQAEVT